MEEQLTEIDFISPCPVQECVNKSTCYRWTHNQCGGRLKLNNEGMLRCLKCVVRGPFGGTFNCGDHDYKESSAQGVAHALAGMAQTAVDKDQQKFIAKTTSAIFRRIVEGVGGGGWLLNGKRLIEEPLTKEQIKEIYLISPCPVQDCVNKNKCYRWTHNKCGGGRLSLNDEGILRCLKCGKKGKFVDFKFNCGDHNSKECSAQGVSHSLASMAQTTVEKSQQRFIATTLAAIMKQCMDGREEYEGKTRYKGGYEKGKRGINLDGEESNESPFQKVEEPPEEDEEDTDQHKHIDKLLEETLECLLEMKKKSNKINAFINKSKELMIAMHDYIIYNHIYWYKNDYDKHDNKVEEILTVCEELQMKGYSSNLFFFIRNILNPHTQNNEDDYA